MHCGSHALLPGRSVCGNCPRSLFPGIRKSADFHAPWSVFLNNQESDLPELPVLRSGIFPFRRGWSPAHGNLPFLQLALHTDSTSRKQKLLSHLLLLSRFYPLSVSGYGCGYGNLHHLKSSQPEYHLLPAVLPARYSLLFPGQYTHLLPLPAFSLSSATESCLPVVPVLFLLRLSLSFFSLDDTGDTDLPQLPEFPLPGFFPAAHPSVCPAPRLMPAPASFYLPDYADKSDVPKVFAELRHSAILWPPYDNVK